MTVTRVGWLALALTSGCLRFGYDAASSDHDLRPDAGLRDAGVARVDAGKRDAAAGGGGGKAASSAHPVGGAGGFHAAGSGGAGGSGSAGSGQGGATAPGTEQDAGVVDVNQMLGNTGLIVNDILGYYSSSWGDMVLQAQGDEIWGVYSHEGGTVVGNIASDGLFTGWWSQTPTRTGMDAGEVEFTWTQGAGMPIKLMGRWRWGTFGAWFNDWNLDRITDRSAPSSLTDMFSQPDQFRRHP